MAEEQPQDLTAGITAGTGHRHRSHPPILHVYAFGCKFILHARRRVVAPDRRAANLRPAAPRPPGRRGGCRRIAGRAGLVLGQGAIRRPEPQGQRQRLAVLPDLRARVDVEQRDILNSSPAPARTASMTARGRHIGRHHRLRSWKTAGNGDTRGAGNTSVTGTASRFSSTAQVPLGSPARSITAGCSCPAWPTTGRRRDLGAPPGMPRQVLGCAQPDVDAAGAGDHPHRLECVGGLDGRPGPQGPRGSRSPVRTAPTCTG